jgi:1,4-alpha-glucan branching enzyme
VNWDAAARPEHKGISTLVRDLNRLYRETPALHVKDCEGDGFQWIDAADAEQSILSFVRRGHDGDAPCVVISNFTPVERTGYKIGLPAAGHWAEVLNTDAGIYGGGGRGNLGGVTATAEAWHGQPASALFTIPPLSTLILKQD